jgi:hypothetical protein
MSYAVAGSGGAAPPITLLTEEQLANFGPFMQALANGPASLLGTKWAAKKLDHALFRRCGFDSGRLYWLGMMSGPEKARWFAGGREIQAFYNVRKLEAGFQAFHATGSHSYSFISEGTSSTLSVDFQSMTVRLAEPSAFITLQLRREAPSSERALARARNILCTLVPDVPADSKRGISMGTMCMTR